MRRVEGQLVVSPTDLTRFVACEHLTALDVEVANGERAMPPKGVDKLLELLFTKGDEHETRYLETLREQREVTVIAATGSPQDRAAETEKAIVAGADVIYQAAFCHDGRVGVADFLLRVERPSRLGAWSYDVADTKLARRLKVPALLQMAAYGEHLRRIQGAPPEILTVVAGDGVQHPVAFASVEAYARRLTSRFDTFVADPPATTAEPVPYCEQCRWVATCSRGWRAVDHLSYVAFLGTRQRHELEAAGITTMAQLGGRTVDDLPRSISRDARTRLLRQARLQLEERADGEPHYELLAPSPGLGLLALPEPDAADLYLDFEADRYVEPDGREFLAGLGDTRGVFTALWAHSSEAEKRLTEELIDRILATWQQHPGMHVYHYAPYERAALTRLAQRHATREAELDILLRAAVLVDLYAVVRQGVVISKESYSIKKLEAFYWGAERSKNADVAEALSSVLAYERWLVDHEQRELDAIEAYNKDDVDSTRDLHRWLENRRTELCETSGEAFARPTATDVERTIPNAAELAEAALVERLLATGHDLLAGLVGWHRREDRPSFWEFFHYAGLDDEELIDDAKALGGLEEPSHMGDEARSRIWRYPVPLQETRISAGDDAVDVDTRKRVGEVRAIDVAAGWVDLKVSEKKPAPTSRALQPGSPVSTAELRDSIARTAEAVLDGRPGLAQRLLDRVVPTTLPVREGEEPVAALVRVGGGLSDEVLAVQGPPGTGKSHSAAKLIRALLDQGKRVGVTAQSHAVIGELLTTVGRRALQKCDPSQSCGAPFVTSTTNNQEVADALADRTHTLVGGSAWLWSRDGMRDSVDVLVVDEAGQFSLANAVAVAPAARAMVLLGDPQQLTQPTQAEHPYGAGVSALAYLLDGRPTIAPERGIFFDSTYRMHPTITEFVSVTSYEGRLASRPYTARQRLDGDGRFRGSGLRWIPVPHVGNTTSAPEEVDVVVAAVTELLAAPWTDHDGRTERLSTAEILVVAPYNAQVALLRDAVPGDVRVGTVDKFQGRQGAVTLFSLTSSTAADAPRGLGFLYDTHRLNVAVSRAKAMAVLVGSPALLDAPVGRADQLPLVNAYCRFVESAETLDV